MMRRDSTRKRTKIAAPLTALALALTFATPALATPFHARAKALDVAGLNHACGVAVDSKGDLYASSAGESKVNVYNPSHTLLTSIPDANEPCGLAVTTTGVLYVSEKATGEVVQFKPSKYPFEGTPSYGSREVIDASTKAKGIAVDPVDDTLYVAEGDRVGTYVHELQTVTLKDITGGSFKLKFGGEETEAIKFDASAEEVQKALQTLTTIGAKNVEVVKYPGSGEVFSSYSVFFTGKFAYTDVETMGTVNSLTGTVNPRITVAEKAKGFSGQVGEGTLTEASGVAAYSYAIFPSGIEKVKRYLWVADANGLLPDRLELFAGRDTRALKPSPELTGSTTPDGSFGFGPKGAYLAADPGDRTLKGECKAVGEEACTAGHLFLYDATHKALDEFDASGEYLDQTRNAGFADAEPTAIALDRSGGSGDGTLYVTAGAGAGAKALAFAPLKAPHRAVLGEPLSHVLAASTSVAVDAHGYVYVAQASLIHVYKPNGEEVFRIVKDKEGKEQKKPLFEDKALFEVEGKFEEKGAKPFDLAVDSTGKVYVLDERGGSQGEEEVTYYTPSEYPPKGGTTPTTYTRHTPAVVIPSKFPNVDNLIQAIAINPGPSSGKDHLFVTTRPETQEYDSAANGSGLLNKEFAGGLDLGNRQSIAVNGANGNVYFGSIVGGVSPAIFIVDSAGKEILAQFENTGAANGKFSNNPFVAVEQDNGHVITFDLTSSVREYDAAGSFVAQFGNFTEGLLKPFRLAVDNSCAIQGLSGKACEEFDPANDTAYLAFDDTNNGKPPFDVNAFGPLTYATPTKHKLTVERKGTGSGTVKGGSKAEPSTINCGVTCEHEYLETEVVTLTAEPAAKNSEFIGWGKEDCERETVSPAEGTCEVSLDEAKKVVAEFEKGIVEKEFPLEIVFKGPGSGNVTSTPEGIDCESTCSAMFPEGPVTLTAKEAQDSEFLKWSGCESEPVPVSGNMQCEVEVTEPKVVVEVEFDVEHPLLTVNLEGSGSGKVTSVPPGIECPSTCSHKFNPGDEVTLTAKAESGSAFVGWGKEDCEAETISPSEGTCAVTMDKPRQVTATFDALPQVIAKQALPVLYDEATLRGEIDPSGLATEYHFEYLTEEEYEDNGETFEGAQKTPKGELTPTKGLVAVEAPLLGLEEGTEYRFRLQAMNSVGPAEDEGPPFATLQRSALPPCPNAAYRFGLSADLPDCRAYELVTPAQTNGLGPHAVAGGESPSNGFADWYTPQRGEAAGERLSYFTDGTLPGFDGNGLLDGYRAERGADEHPVDGWQSTLFSPSYTETAGSHPVQIGVASDQLYSIWEVKPETGPGSAIFPDTLARGIYLRTPTGFEALGDPEALSRYVSPGGAHAIFASSAHLESEAPPAPNAALYDHVANTSETRVLTLPPAGASAEEKAEFEAALRSKEQAKYQGVSEDGAAVAFKAGVGLYVRLNDSSTEGISPRTAEVGDTLACAAGPQFGIGSGDQRNFQWLRNGIAIVGASGSDIGNVTDYRTQGADKGAALQCLTVATSKKPRSVAISSPVEIAPLTTAQVPQPPAQVSPPTPASPAEGTLETCDPGSWQGTESFSYQWFADGKEIPGATSQTYKVQAGDVPGTLQCVVKGTNAAATVAEASELTPTSPAPAETAPVATAQALPKTTYAGASEDGRYVFYVLGNGEEPGRLFRFDTQSEAPTEIASAGTFALVSPGGSHAFFSSAEALTGSEESENGEVAEVGAHNFYAWDGTTTRFIGRLTVSDFKQGGFTDIPEMTLANWTQAIAHNGGSGRALDPTRSTPGGGVFVFQSHARLTTFDNEGVGEIYRYDPSAPAGERLLCVSCDPTGTAPSADALLEDVRNGAGSLNMRNTMIANLTEDGNAVFFQSFDRLLPEDANEVEDVYEWKAKGSGGCTRPDGCLALISSGQGEGPSSLYAMSADGHDVFFETSEKLVGLDVAGSPSIYDARVGGGIPEPAEPAPCQGDACQGQGSEPPALPNLSSDGPGEEPQVEVPATRKHCTKGKHRVKGRCVAAKHKHRKHHRRARAHRGGSQ